MSQEHTVLLKKYGYKEESGHGSKSKSFRHKDGHIVQVSNKGDWGHVNTNDDKGITTGRGHDSLGRHLVKLHGSQHTEESIEDRSYTQHLKNGGEPLFPETLCKGYMNEYGFSPRVHC